MEYELSNRPQIRKPDVAIDRHTEDARPDIARARGLSHELERLDRAGSPYHVHAARQTKRLPRRPALDSTQESKLTHRDRERAFGMGMLELDAYKRPGHCDSLAHRRRKPTDLQMVRGSTHDE